MSKLANADNCTPLLAAAGVGALGDGDEAAGTDEEAIEAVQAAAGTWRRHQRRGRQRRNRDARRGVPEPFQLVQLFAEHRADIKVWNRKNKAGWTPLIDCPGTSSRAIFDPRPTRSPPLRSSCVPKASRRPRSFASPTAAVGENSLRLRRSIDKDVDFFDCRLVVDGHTSDRSNGE